MVSQVLQPSLEFAVPPPQPAGEKKAGGGCLSCQSIAARERSKRISEKTRELGRLIPDGNKMNTAEMFQAAFKYVKFLQAQVGILSLTSPIMQNSEDAQKKILVFWPGGEDSVEVAENLQLLLKSPIIQEKLSVEEKCIVPREMLDATAKDSDIRSTQLISKYLNCFAKLNGSKSMGR